MGKTTRQYALPGGVEAWSGWACPWLSKSKAAYEDRMFIVFGPQVIVEESGPRVLTPEAMDVIG